jgi:purine-nucleoside phosphorylase
VTDPDSILRAARQLADVASEPPRLALTLGSGLAGLVDAVADPVRVPFDALPGLPSAGAPGHGGGAFVLGRLEGVRVIVQAGRIHLYDGLGADAVAAPVRILAALGVDTLVLTNAAGGIRTGLEPGDLLLIADHLDLSFRPPLRGPLRPHEDRFPDMSAPWDAELRSVFRACADEEGVGVEEGTYACVAGPQYETRSEVRMLARLGADVVGMSTVPEVEVARALGLRVAGISLVTNRATGMATHPLSHEEVLDVGRRAGARLERLLRAFLRRADQRPEEGGGGRGPSSRGEGRGEAK